MANLRSECQKQSEFCCGAESEAPPERAALVILVMYHAGVLLEADWLAVFLQRRHQRVYDRIDGALRSRHALFEFVYSLVTDTAAKQILL